MVTSLSFKTEGASKTEVVGKIVLVRLENNRCTGLKLIFSVGVLRQSSIDNQRSFLSC